MEFKTILLIDDDEDDKVLFMEAVDDIDHGLVGITSGNCVEALKIIYTSQSFPDLILVDIHMHLMDGFECISMIKQSPQLRNIPVAIYSTEISEAHKAAAQMMGVSQFIIKPSSYSQIVSAIKTALDMTSTPSS